MVTFESVKTPILHPMEIAEHEIEQGPYDLVYKKVLTPIADGGLWHRLDEIFQALHTVIWS